MKVYNISVTYAPNKTHVFPELDTKITFGEIKELIKKLLGVTVTGNFIFKNNQMLDTCKLCAIPNTIISDNDKLLIIPPTPGGIDFF